ncbi:DNA-binding transcriptional MerR regulator [Mesorhizobium sp. J18]|uniref:MerR family transcriptional regulator n=1 Tax=Mesorhizobium sp. J18 TaxID=935263 RepID=UPI00119ABFC5|nr:MerR family DNA-binding transcriptional regulator [Mesorhizobium sp. J18]TWG99944.1 DNA-binding transcriptional MerR regulator [Mesorhizobium sp. J18]
MNMIPASKAMANASAVADKAGKKDNYTRIGEMAEEFGVTLRALRFYEDKGLIQPKREGITRLYTYRDKARLKLILLGRRVGFSLRDIKQIIDLYDPAGTNMRQYKVVLEKSQRQLARLEKQRAAIADAIAELTRLTADMRAQMEARATAAKR